MKADPKSSSNLKRKYYRNRIERHDQDLVAETFLSPGQGLRDRNPAARGHANSRIGLQPLLSRHRRAAGST
ncbi:hypothetical protein EVAR_61561_1 [Eumeta japonica]|uniref:Uncharacterized protein n=1 Tax=Eumeta variegata TaxID=151549 RepID=A0A4C1YTP4_EUMVA|nr:hypothetical protein EVAR_61561_1 [Eumeta japonica]